MALFFILFIIVQSVIAVKLLLSVFLLVGLLCILAYSDIFKIISLFIVLKIVLRS